jgi:hypothetical protein
VHLFGWLEFENLEFLEFIWNYLAALFDSHWGQFPPPGLVPATFDRAQPLEWSRFGRNWQWAAVK